MVKIIKNRVFIKTIFLLSFISSIIYSNDFDSWGSFYLQLIGETETAQLASHGFCPSFSQDSTTIVYVGHYQTNKDVNYITN
jgi:hypothetical protein